MSNNKGPSGPFSPGDLVRIKESAISPEALKGYVDYYHTFVGINEQWFKDKIKPMVGTVMAVCSMVNLSPPRCLVTNDGSAFGSGFMFRPQDLELVFTK